MSPLYAAELMVRASLEKQAIHPRDKAILGVASIPVVAGGMLYGANKLMGNPVKREVQKHRMRMRQHRATIDPRTRRLI